jgi:hypothetical protein
MTIKASGRSALILAAGMFVCFAGPSQAAATADGTAATSKSESVRTAHSRHWKRVAHRRTSKVAEKSAPVAKAEPADDNSTANSTALPASVANANAQLASADTPAGNAQAMTARANNILQAAPDSSANVQVAQVVAPDQLNDVDRALHENTQIAPPPVTMASAEAPAPAAPAPAMASTSTENSTWDQTSLIGKIFIGFGALLTMASAARMFMA